MTAKILAAGGAKVCITYYKGENDAKKVINDINSNGGISKMYNYDINMNDKSQFLNCKFIPTDLYYFATPSILPGKRGLFSNELYNLYSLFYLSNFMILLDFGLKNKYLNIFILHQFMLMICLKI